MVKIFLLKTSKGFTIIEVMIVLVLVTSIISISLARLNSPGKQAMNSLNIFKQVFKEIQFASKLQNTTYRIVVDIGDPSKDDNKQSYWIEISTRRGIQLDGESLEDRLKTDPDDKKAKADFVMHTKIIKRKQELPSVLKFVDVELLNIDKPINEDKAYIYFLPQGLVTAAAIHLNLLDKKRTLAINPLTGRGTLLNSYRTLKDIMDR